VSVSKLTEAQRAAMFRVLYAMRFRFTAESRGVVHAEFGARVTEAEIAAVNAAVSVPYQVWESLRKRRLIEGSPMRLTEAGRTVLRDKA
jgi:hypothetical protein